MSETTTTQSRERQFLKVFQKVTKLVSMVLDHQQVMDTIVSTLPGLLEVDACTIRLLDSSTQTFVMGAAHGLSLEYLSRQAIDTDETMEMIKAGYPVAKNDIDKNSSYQGSEAVCREGIKSILSLPILFQDSIIGIMRLLTKSHRLFTDDEISFAMALAEQVGIAISNARMFNAMENQVDFMKEVQALTRLVHSTLDLDTVLRTFVERVSQSIGAKACTISLLSSRSNNLELVAAYGLTADYLAQVHVETEDNLVVLPEEPLAVYDVAADERIGNKRHIVAEGIKSLLAVPVKVGDEVIGVLRILSDEFHCFTSSEVNFAVTVSEAGGTAIQNARNYQKMNLLFNQIEENERFLSDILDCIRPQLLVVDRNKHIVLANRIVLEQLGKPENEVLGMEYSDLCPSDGAGGLCPVEQALKTGANAVYVHEVNLADGRHWFERSASPMFDKDGRVEFVIEIVRDITSRQRHEDEKMELVKLQGVVEMAGTAAHEINSPLFAALGTAQLLAEDLGGEDSENMATIIRNLKAIKALTRKMTRMTGFRSRDYIGGAKIVEMTD
ncbi:MAG TPA: GAF domain-containing protein [Desulfobacterales bacterium]|nr:GAF domain-containing protein [Desulfobacterales bacterium]